jgi:hypothetical protein
VLGWREGQPTCLPAGKRKFHGLSKDRKSNKITFNLI